MRGLGVACALGLMVAAPAARANEDITLPGLDLHLVWLPPGELLLGSPDDEPSRGLDEGPVTRVSLTKGFWIGRTEVTQRQWHAVMGTNPSRFIGATHPVEQVSWQEAIEFARRIDARERAAGRVPPGYRYGLPTEAQWEYAARAGGNGAFTMNVDEHAWHDQNSGGSTRPVASKKPNAWGLHDMLGNVWEWCADWYAPYPGRAIPDFAGPAHGTAKASRGGSWWAGPRGARPANRYRDMQQNGNDDLGFRLALVPVIQPPAGTTR